MPDSVAFDDTELRKIRRTLDPTGLFSTRSVVAAVSCHVGTRLMLLAGFAFGAAASSGSGRHVCFADSFPGSLARQTTGKERQDGTEKPTPEQMRIGASTSALSKIDPALLSKTDPWPARGRGR